MKTPVMRNTSFQRRVQSSRLASVRKASNDDFPVASFPGLMRALVSPVKSPPQPLRSSRGGIKDVYSGDVTELGDLATAPSSLRREFVNEITPRQVSVLTGSSTPDFYRQVVQPSLICVPRDRSWMGSRSGLSNRS
jgi:hypothetical protein